MGRLELRPGLLGSQTELVSEVRRHLDPLLSRTILGLGFAVIQVVLRLIQYVGVRIGGCINPGKELTKVDS